MFAGSFQNFGVTKVKAIIFLCNVKEKSIYPQAPFDVKFVLGESNNDYDYSSK